jgi:hypothetical protein
MPTYPVINKVTGEQKDVRMTMAEWSQWSKDNPDWQRDWSCLLYTSPSPRDS